jgi:hypothetical protein
MRSFSQFRAVVVAKRRVGEHMKTVHIRQLPAVPIATFISTVRLLEGLTWQVVTPLYFRLFCGKVVDDTTFGTKIVMWIYQCLLPALVSGILAYCTVMVFNRLARLHEAVRFTTGVDE